MSTDQIRVRQKRLTERHEIAVKIRDLLDQARGDCGDHETPDEIETEVLELVTDSE